MAPVTDKTPEGEARPNQTLGGAIAAFANAIVVGEVALYRRCRRE